MVTACQRFLANAWPDCFFDARREQTLLSQSGPMIQFGCAVLRWFHQPLLHKEITAQLMKDYTNRQIRVR